MRTFALALLLAACSSQPESAEPEPEPAPEPPAPAPAPATELPAEAQAEAPEPAEPSLTFAEKQQIAGEMVAMFEEVGAAITATAGDCAAMATAIDTIANNNAGLIGRLHRLSEQDRDERDPEFERWFNETHGEALKATMMGAMGAMQTCATDEGVKNAFERLLPR